MSRLELAIAWRYLRSRRGSRLLSLSTVIAIGGVVVGVAALIVIIGVMNGLQSDLREKILVGSPDIRVLMFGDELKMSDWKRVMSVVKAQPGVVTAAPFVLTEGLARAGGRSYQGGVSVAGIVPGGPPGTNVTTIREKATMGDFTFATKDGKRRGAVVGRLLAERFNAFPGTSLTLFTLAGVSTNPITGFAIPRGFEFEVTGVFETGMYEYDNQYVFMDIEHAKVLAGLGQAVTGVEVRTTSRDSAMLVARALIDTLHFPYHTVDWGEQNAALFRALKLEKLGMAVILGLIVVVAAFNIVSTLTMVVHDKTREIGILKAMGLRRAAVRRIFLVQGLVIGTVGTGLGLLIGLVAGLALDRYHLITLDPQVYFIDHLPVRMLPQDVALIVFLSVVVATLATLYPSDQASKLFPVDAIRSE